MKTIITSIGTVASIISLTALPGIPLWGKIIICVIGIVSFAFLLIDHYRGAQVNEIKCKNDSEIKESMKRIIKSQGKICIMSRDLSWVDDDIKKCFKEKGSSLLIFVQKENKDTREIASYGAEIQYYNALGWEPKTRFTVIRYNRDHPQVAIANTQDTIRRRNKFVHTIYETSQNNCKQDDFIASLAMDLISLCKKSVNVER